MLLRHLAAMQSSETESAFDAFVKVQNSPGLPCGVIKQSEHSRVAGALARGLRPELFGALDGSVIEAIAHHDYGWDESDDEQLRTLYDREPHPFTKVSPEDTLPSWISSIAKAKRLGPLQEVLISRHCCLLGTGSGKHARFVAGENARRSELERTLPYTSEELDRWTAALGFCDLLSLYLCCGSQTSVRLPLAHPDAADGARYVTAKWVDGELQFSEPVLDKSVEIEADAVRYQGERKTNEPIRITFALRSE